jgi:hypothetical protein
MGTASSKAPYFGNAPTIGIYTLHKSTFHIQEHGSWMVVLSLFQKEAEYLIKLAGEELWWIKF